MTGLGVQVSIAVDASPRYEDVAFQHSLTSPSVRSAVYWMVFAARTKSIQAFGGRAQEPCCRWAPRTLRVWRANAWGSINVVR